MIELVDAIGSMILLKGFIESSFVDEIRNVDHDVVDVGRFDAYAGSIVLKADGMKVYVFCYPNG